MGKAGNAKNTPLDEALAEALMEGSLRDVRSLLARGASANGQAAQRGGRKARRLFRPLETAMHGGSVECASALLEAGADPLAGPEKAAPVLALAACVGSEMLDLMAAAVSLALDRKKAARTIAFGLAMAAELGQAEAVASLARLREPALEGRSMGAKIERAMRPPDDSAIASATNYERCARAIVETSELEGPGGLLAQRAWLRSAEARGGMEAFKAQVEWAIAAREAVLIGEAAGPASAGSAQGRGAPRL